MQKNNRSRMTDCLVALGLIAILVSLMTWAPGLIQRKESAQNRQATQAEPSGIEKESSDSRLKGGFTTTERLINDLP